MATLGLNEEKMRRLAKTYDKDAKKLRDVGKDIERKLKTLDGQMVGRRCPTLRRPVARPPAQLLGDVRFHAG